MAPYVATVARLAKEQLAADTALVLGGAEVYALMFQLVFLM